MGRLAKPTKIKTIEGNPGKRKLNRKEPQPIGAPLAPASLSPSAATVWKRLVLAVPPGIFSSADEAILMAYSEAVALHRLAAVALTTEPPISIGSTGQQVVSPWVKIMADQARLIVTLGAKLGLDPVSRQALNTPQTVQDDPFAGLIN